IQMGAVQELRQKIDSKKMELDRLFDDIEALQHALNILERETKKRGRKPIQRQLPLDHVRELVRTKNRRPIKEVVAHVLREAGKPLSTSQLIPLVYAQGVHGTTQTIVGAVYRSIKRKEPIFRLVASGVF